MCTHEAAGATVDLGVCIKSTQLKCIPNLSQKHFWKDYN